jgi:hypothetical protein
MSLDFHYVKCRFNAVAPRAAELDADYAVRCVAIGLLEGIQTFFSVNPSIDAIAPVLLDFNVDGRPINLKFLSDSPLDQPACDHLQASVDNELKVYSNYYKWSAPQMEAIANYVFNHGHPDYTPLTRDNLVEGVLRTVGDEVGLEVRAMMESEKLGTGTDSAKSRARSPRL